MTKKLILVTAMVAVMCGCSSHPAEETASEETAIDTAALIQRVEDIYGEVFKVYNEEDSLRNLDIVMDPDVHARRYEFMHNYCSEKWEGRARQVDRVDSLMYGNGKGFWEGDYWIMGQDWHNLSISDVKLLSLRNNNRATVELQLHNLDTATPVLLELVNEGGAWKIDNFIDVKNNFNWGREILDYLKLNLGSH